MLTQTDPKVLNLKSKANEIRKTVLKMVYKAQSSHIGSNFSSIDFLTVLFDRVNLDIDEVIFSKGWIAASAYAFLADKGIIPKGDLKRYCEPGSPYIGLVEPTVPGIKAAGGSMGYGLPFGVGFALAKKLQNQKGKVYVIQSDGEQQIGTTWESAMIAAHHKLDNLVVIVDLNRLQGMGKTKDVLNIEPLAEKWDAFGWDVRIVNGHSHSNILHALTYPQLCTGKPVVILAHTRKGFPVSFMLDNNLYHYKNLSRSEYLKALVELKSYA